RVQKGEKLLVHLTGEQGVPLARQVIKEVYAAGGLPFFKMENSAVKRELLLNCTEEQIAIDAHHDCILMDSMDAYIGINASTNLSGLAGVSAEKNSLYQKFYFQPVHRDRRVRHTKWVILRYPTDSMAQAAEKSSEDFEDFFFDVCCLDYSKMEKAMQPLVRLMEQTDKVRITGVNTDISFSIKNIPAIPCAGQINIPDGEVYTAPVKDSVNGVISYNTPSEYLGFTYENIQFTFKDGKIIKATSNNNDRINEVLDTDEGARFIGEFAIGVNPYIEKPMKNTLFDEKIKGSFHFTPGNSYDEADNTNKSAIHWDLVNIQTPEYGGGEIYFDGKLIRKDGLFVIPELEPLNPENLK
ncbi:MAG: aminopeptidase, partial [Clostridiales bacterium]|nr:aminopeptidase [Clostridiales bacterium]